MCIYIYIYIYIERERETYKYVCMYIYIYITEVLKVWRDPNRARRSFGCGQMGSTSTLIGPLQK